MAGYCFNCGAQLVPGARFCPECGSPCSTEETPAPPVSASEPVQSAAPAADVFVPAEEFDAPVATAVREKKPRPKWLLPVGIAAAVVVAALVAFSMVLKTLHGPEKAMEKFLSAMDAGDLAALQAIAHPAEEDAAFTEESAAPMFALYKQSAQFRKTLENCLEDDIDLIDDEDEPNEDNVVYLAAKKSFLHTAYEVEIAGCSVELYSPLTATVSLTGGRSGETRPEESDDDFAAADDSAYYMDCPDSSLLTGGTVTFDDLLPGLYEAAAEVTTTMGDTFAAECSVEVMDQTGTNGVLEYEYSAMTVYNDSVSDVDLYIDGQLYGSVPSGYEFYFVPIAADREVEARMEIVGSEPMTQTFTAAQCDGYENLSFVLCEVEIDNQYEQPMNVFVGDVLLGQVQGWSSLVPPGVPLGTELTFSMGLDEVIEPYLYECTYEYDSITPQMSLTEQAQADLEDAAKAYAENCYTLYQAQDLEGLRALPETALSNQLATWLEYHQTYTMEEYGFDYGVELSPIEEFSIEGADIFFQGGIPVVQFYFDTTLTYEEQYAYEASEYETTDGEDVAYNSLTFSYDSGSWRIVPTDQ